MKPIAAMFRLACYIIFRFGDEQSGHYCSNQSILYCEKKGEVKTKEEHLRNRSLWEKLCVGINTWSI